MIPVWSLLYSRSYAKKNLHTHHLHLLLVIMLTLFLHYFDALNCMMFLHTLAWRVSLLVKQVYLFWRMTWVEKKGHLPKVAKDPSRALENT
jgi:hypothetical protein